MKAELITKPQQPEGVKWKYVPNESLCVSTSGILAGHPVLKTDEGRYIHLASGVERDPNDVGSWRFEPLPPGSKVMITA